MLRDLLIASCLCAALTGCGSDGQIDLGASATGGRPGDGGVGGGTADATAGCASSAECIGERAFCELSSETCVQCLVAGHCVEPGKTCDPVGFECKDACSGDPECSSGGEPFCDTTRKVCIECVQDADCTSGSEQRCLSAVGKCVECRGDSDCTNAESPFCPLAQNECSECLVDGHCPAGKRCDRDDFQCRD